MSRTVHDWLNIIDGKTDLECAQQVISNLIGYHIKSKHRSEDVDMLRVVFHAISHREVNRLDTEIKDAQTNAGSALGSFAQPQQLAPLSAPPQAPEATETEQAMTQFLSECNANMTLKRIQLADAGVDLESVMLAIHTKNDQQFNLLMARVKAAQKSI